MKTYKTARGLNNALKKVLGEPSKATSEGTMTDGYLMFPVEMDNLYRIIFIKGGYPVSLLPVQINTLVTDFCAEPYSSKMFGKTINFVEISLEVSK